MRRVSRGNQTRVLAYLDFVHDARAHRRRRVPQSNGGQNTFNAVRTTAAVRWRTLDIHAADTVSATLG
jgi:hypothetical protein